MKLFLFLFALVFFSCHPVKKALKVASQNPQAFNNFCAEKFPATDAAIVTVDSTRLDTLYIESAPIIQTTTHNDTIFKTVYYPGSTQFVTKTVRKDSLITKIDTKLVTAKQEQIDNLIIVNKDLVKKADKSTWWKRACLITWGILLALIVGWVIAKIYGK